jgi:hypothetical protein
LYACACFDQAATPAGKHTFTVSAHPQAQIKLRRAVAAEARQKQIQAAKEARCAAGAAWYVLVDDHGIMQ